MKYPTHITKAYFTKLNYNGVLSKAERQMTTDATVITDNKSKLSIDAFYVRINKLETHENPPLNEIWLHLSLNNYIIEIPIIFNEWIPLTVPLYMNRGDQLEPYIMIKRINDGAIKLNADVILSGTHTKLKEY